jgi:hypothetical protein
MANPVEILESMRGNSAGVRFADLCKVCDHYFGQARQSSGSHRVYKTPWIGDPRVNIQNSKGQAKVYQVKQVLKAIERLEVKYGTEK